LWWFAHPAAPRLPPPREPNNIFKFQTEALDRNRNRNHAPATAHSIDININRINFNALSLTVLLRSR